MARLWSSKRRAKSGPAIEDGVRESTQSWREVLLSLKDRGMNAPKLAIRDGAMGFWAALEEVYRADQKADKLWRYLTRRRRTRRALRTRPSRDTIKNRVSIHERPENVNNRSQIGNWEADLIICQRSRPVLVLHERKSRVTLAAKLTGKSAAETAGAIMAIFKRLDPVLRQSITFDNGTEFARHSLLKETLGMATWFCDAYASWQKGGIENANGRLRRWLPRKTNLDEVSDEDIQEIVMTYNLTPRKCLGYITPIQALFQNLGRDVRLTFA